MQVPFDAAQQQQAVFGVRANCRAGIGERLANDLGCQRITVFSKLVMTEQCRYAAIQRVQFFVAGFSDLGGELAYDDMFGQIAVVDQGEAFEIRDFERCFARGGACVAAVLATLGLTRQIAPKRFDEMRPVFFDVGAQVEVAGL